MEGFQNNFESIKVPDWRNLKMEAPSKAEQMISDVEGYNDMTPEEQMQELASLIEKLFKEGNENRYIANELAREHALVEEGARHSRRLRQLGVTA